jgi:hypothetical protein
MYDFQGGKSNTPSTPKKSWSTVGVPLEYEWSTVGVGVSLFPP